jgi:predicted ATPase/class 3 adenylate cyclase
MDFYAVLDQVVNLLRSRGRVSYRALKQQFALDDELLADLKAELRYARYPVVEDDDQGLVWAGETGPPAAESAPPPLPETEQDPHTARPPPGPRAPEAERRQLTVLFCDLVDSTVLASRLDPEDWREVVRAYQEMCAKVIARFEGHIAQCIGDGLLVYFGYPQAHEDDAQRAVRAGLDILTAMGTLNTRLEREKGVRVAIRVGIHTGPVVAGEIGGRGPREPLALGETPNLAARLQSLAAPNSMLIGERTRRLVGGAFDVEELGLHALKGVSVPMRVYGIRGESVAESRFEAASARGLTPLIGREAELGLLLQRWQQAKAGEGQVFLLAGEAGIGKSRLIQTVLERVTEEPHVRLQYQCSPYYSHSAFYPIIAQLERGARFARDDTPAQKLDKLETLLAQGTARVAEVAPLFAALLSVPTDDRYPPLSLSPERQKAQTIVAFVEQLVGLSRHQPVLFLLEDAHWCDPTTLEVLDQLVHRTPELRVLVLITARPEFTAPWTASHLTTLTLTRLGRAQVATMVAQLTAGKALPTEVLAQILARTGGVPLFVEELTKTILESGLLREVGERYLLTEPLPPLAIPATVQDSLMARLDRLAPVKEVAQLGAALGREFTYALVAAVASLGEAALPDALEQLVRAGLLFRHGQPPEAHYRFKHALVQEAAYASLLRSRRQELHRRIATVLEARFPAIAETQPEVVAGHYTEAGLPEQAIPYWQRAGQRAIARSANVEALSHLTRALTLLKILPDAPERRQQELTLLTAVGTPLVLTKGHAAPEVEATYARARELSRQLGDSPQLFSALLGLLRYHFNRGELRTVHELGEQLLRLAKSRQESGLLGRAHQMVAENLMWLGEFARARAHAEQRLALYDPQQHRDHVFRFGTDSGVCCRFVAAMALWVLGYPDQGLQRSNEALALAQALAHPFTLGFALQFAALLHQLRREVALTHVQAEALIALATEQGFAMWMARGPILRGWALAEQGQAADGLAQIRQGLAIWQAMGSQTGLHMTYDSALMAGAYGQMERPAEGLSVLTEALAHAHTTGERFYEAELHRLKGELLLLSEVRAPKSEVSTPHVEDAEACFRQALEIARCQQAKSLELRAAMSLSRLWQHQGKRAHARQLLAELYGWFTQGFDTADLQEAKALLEELKR